MSLNSNGSIWRKCDLHIHTPFSIEQHYGDSSHDEIWEKFISDLENEENYPQGSMIGISDYYFLEGYQKVISYQQKGRLKNIAKIFPLIELRLKEFGGSKHHLSRVNYHVLFNPDSLSVQIIKDQFISALHSQYQLSPAYSAMGIKWDGCLTRKNLEELGKKIKETVPNNELQNYGSDFKEGFNNYNISREKIEAILNREFFKNNTLCLVGKTEWSEIEWNDHSIAEKKDIINKVHFLFNSYDNPNKYKVDFKHQTEAQVNNRLLDCSDAHYFSQSSEKDRIGNCSLWIKGKPCFETIRQAFFSYDTRIRISEICPVQAINVLNRIEVNLPSESSIGDTECCFAGQTIKVDLNPALNCFIGGRGTGKSLLLQLFCKNNPSSLPKEEKNIVDKIIPKNWKDYVNIDDIEFEYFGQGTIEKFYENKELFQQCISSRLYQFWETEEYVKNPQTNNNKSSLISEINREKENLRIIVEKIEGELNLTNQKIQNDQKIISLRKEITSRKKLLDALNDERYLSLQKNIANVNKQKSFIDKTKQNLIDLSNEIYKIQQKFNTIEISNDETINYYAAQYNKILQGIKELEKFTNIEKNCEEIEKNIEEKLQKAEIELKNYLNERGMSPLNIQDAIRAQRELETFILQQNQLETDNAREDLDIDFLRKNIISASLSYKQTMDKILQKTEDFLKKKENDEISKLTFKYKYNTNLMQQDIYSFFKNYTHIDKGDFEAILKRRSPEESKDLTSEVLEELCNKNQDLKSACKILNFFNNNFKNKRMYDLNYLLYKYNCCKYENFSILYDRKELENLSFGQRATAIILTLLLFGNKPLIIDEPETHLDQRFIASKLIEVIKQVKQDKQIIFATHNANIVINADSEQIYILKTEQNNKTSFKSMSIEDVYEKKKQEELMMLEGSVEAFKLREKKYSL